MKISPCLHRHLQAGSINCVGGWYEVVTVVRVERRARSVEVGKAGEEQLGVEVVEGEVLQVLLAGRYVAPVGRWCKGGVGAENKGNILEPGGRGDDNNVVPGEGHHAVDHRRNPHQQGDGDLPETKLTQLLEAFVVIHNLSDNRWNWWLNDFMDFLSLHISISHN